MYYFDPEMGGGGAALNFTDFVVVNVHGVCKAGGGLRQSKITLSKHFGGQSG